MIKIKIKMVLLFLFMLSFTCFLTGCSKDYSALITNYNKNISNASNTLIQYYNSLYEVNRQLYIESRKNPLELYGYKVNIDGETNPIVTKDKSGKEQAEIVLLPIDPLCIPKVTKSINGLATYSNQLYSLYTNTLPETKKSSVSSLISNVGTAANTTGFIDTEVISAMSGSKSFIGEIVAEIQRKKRDKKIKEYVNLANPIIQNYLTTLDDITGRLQDSAEANSHYLLKREVNAYNSQISKIKKVGEISQTSEILRRQRLDNIQKDIEFYNQLKSANPSGLIASMKAAQTDLVDYVNAKKKDPKALLVELSRINTIVKSLADSLP